MFRGPGLLTPHTCQPCVFIWPCGIASKDTLSQIVISLTLAALPDSIMETCIVALPFKSVAKYYGVTI